MERKWNLEEVGVLKKEEEYKNLCVCIWTREIIFELDLFCVIQQERRRKILVYLIML